MGPPGPIAALVGPQTVAGATRATRATRVARVARVAEVFGSGTYMRNSGREVTIKVPPTDLAGGSGRRNAWPRPACTS